MIKFPESTTYNKVVPKTAFYSHLEVSTSMKNHFVNDVEKIVWSNKLAPSTVNIEKGKTVMEITVFTVTMKSKECPKDVFVFIDKNIPRHTFFILNYGDDVKLLVNYKEATPVNSAIAYNVTKTFETEWKKKEDQELQLQGLNMDTLYENLVRQVAGDNMAQQTVSLKADVQKTLMMDQKRKELEKLTKQLNAEDNPFKKFILYQQVKEIEKELKQIS